MLKKNNGDFPFIMVTSLMPHNIKAYGISDIGLIRQNNEDSWAELPARNFFVLADGMGGHQAGEVAARETVTLLCQLIENHFSKHKKHLSIKDGLELIRESIINVNSSIFKMSRSNPELRGMGTTLCSLLFLEKEVILAHVGDSRIYRFRSGQLEQLTKDHSLFCDLVDQGQIAHHQANDFLYGNIITKAIGTEPRVDPAVTTTDLKINDVYLMCSDGLSDLLSPSEITFILNSSADLKQTAEALIACANRKGGRDNVTVILAKAEELNEPSHLS